jgi:hypothetical protein
LQGVFAARNDADLGEFNHDTLSLKFLLHFEPFKRWRVDRGQIPHEFKLTESRRAPATATDVAPRSLADNSAPSHLRLQITSEIRFPLSPSNSEDR